MPRPPCLPRTQANVSTQHASIAVFKSDALTPSKSQLTAMVRLLLNNSLPSVNKLLLEYPVSFPAQAVPLAPHPVLSTVSTPNGGYVEAIWSFSPASCSLLLRCCRALMRPHRPRMRMLAPCPYNRTLLRVRRACDCLKEQGGWQKCQDKDVITDMRKARGQSGSAPLVQARLCGLKQTYHTRLRQHRTSSSIAAAASSPR